MTGPRLDLALAGGGLTLPDTGRIVVLAPRAGQDLSALPRERVQVVTGFFPDFEAFRSAGHDCATAPAGPVAAVLVCLPRAKAMARALIAQAAALTEGPVVIDGARVDGIESILRDCRKRVDVSGPINKAHGKLFWFRGGDFADWSDTGPGPVAGGWITAPGVFSSDGVDPASDLLATALPAGLSGRVVDLGAGWGYLSARMAGLPGPTALDLVEADHQALDCARRNVTDPRAAFHWADATTWRPAAPADAVVTNPPFHTSRAADPGLGRAFIRSAAAMLRPGGRIWLVANRHLPYEAVLAEHFPGVEEIAGDARFKVLSGTVAAGRRPRDRVA